MITRVKKLLFLVGAIGLINIISATAATVTIYNGSKSDIEKYIVSESLLHHPKSTLQIITDTDMPLGYAEVDNEVGNRVHDNPEERISESSNSDMLVFKSEKILKAGLFGESKVPTDRYSYFTVRKNVETDEKLVSYHESTDLYDLSVGRFKLQTTSTDKSEQIILNKIKLHFDGGYTAGYNLSRDKVKGGFSIDVVEPNSPADKAGLKVGDIVRKVNGVTVKFSKDTNTHNIPSDISKASTEILTIKSADGKDKDITLQTAYWNPQTKSFGN